MAELHIDIRVYIEEPGPNPHWNHSVEVTIPPDYHDVDIEPFILHEMDKAVTEHQRQHFGEARSAEIIAQYDLRMHVIENLIKFAPRNQTRMALGGAIQAIMDLDREELFSRFQSTRLED